MSKIEQALEKLFESHRIVFWYDEKKELREDFESISLNSFEKLEINNNEFNIKHKILREESDKHFLLYHEGPKPSNEDNWLLDVLLANTEFRTDQAAIWLIELGLPVEFTSLINNHQFFFKSVNRRKALKKILTTDDSEREVLLKMTAACSNCAPRLDEILEVLLGELSTGGGNKLQTIEKSGLTPFLFKKVEQLYGYTATSASIKDFSIELFNDCFAIGVEEPPKLNQDAYIFFKRWKSNYHHRDAFERLSNEYSDLFGYVEKIQNIDVNKIIDIDYFEVVDKFIISHLIERLVNETISIEECRDILQRRKDLHWYEKYKHLYKTIKYACEFLAKLNESDFTISSLAEGISKYTQSWHIIDLQYRRFIYHSIKSGEVTLIEPLKQIIEPHYVNNYLKKINDNWQQFIDTNDNWLIPTVPMQKTFYKEWVKPFIDKSKKVCVIISDAMRYEVGYELKNKIDTHDKFTAKIERTVSTIPSYTQLGMAALLPNNKLELKNDKTVFVDGLSSKGTGNRNKILAEAHDGKAKAITMKELIELDKNDCRTLIREHSVVYIYQNRIDATGDKRETEERVFLEAEETMEELIKMIKKLTAANASNIIVTADHGFLYQHSPLEETDFSEYKAKGAEIYEQKRRFVIGEKLKEDSSLKKFTAKQIGLEGDLEIQIPKSINRLRERGSGSRFVHGGASLQEVIIPVVLVNKKRQSDISKVDVDVIGSSTSVITSGQISVAFNQCQPITNKVQERRIWAGIYTKDEQLISDVHELRFDLTSDRPREREIKTRFILTKDAESANGQDVFLKLKEKVSGTDQEVDYKTVRYTLRRSFTSDFDF